MYLFSNQLQPHAVSGSSPASLRGPHPAWLQPPVSNLLACVDLTIVMWLAVCCQWRQG